MTFLYYALVSDASKLRTGGDELLVFNEETCRFRLFPVVVIGGEQGDIKFGTFVVLTERI